MENGKLVFGKLENGFWKLGKFRGRLYINYFPRAFGGGGGVIELLHFTTLKISIESCHRVVTCGVK